MKDSFEVRIAHARAVHVLEGVLDVVDAMPALTDALRYQPRAAVQIQLAHIGRVGRVGDEGQRPHPSLPQPGGNEARFIYPAHHFAAPQPFQRLAHLGGSDAKRRSPARAAAAQPQHQTGPLLGTPVPR